MTREQLLRSLRRYARNHARDFVVDANKGKGSYYRVTLSGATSTLQKDLNTARIERFLKQLGLKLEDL